MSKARRAAGEFTLIVVGVLTALLIESWASAVSEKRLLESQLQDIEASLRTDELLTDIYVRLFGVMEQAVQSLVNDLDGTVELEPTAELLSLFWASYSPVATGVHRPEAYRNMTASVAAQHLDPELRRSLESYYFRALDADRQMGGRLLPPELRGVVPGRMMSALRARDREAGYAAGSDALMSLADSLLATASDIERRRVASWRAIPGVALTLETAIYDLRNAVVQIQQPRLPREAVLRVLESRGLGASRIGDR